MNISTGRGSRDGREDTHRAVFEMSATANNSSGAQPSTSFHNATPSTRHRRKWSQQDGFDVGEATEQQGLLALHNREHEDFDEEAVVRPPVPRRSTGQHDTHWVPWAPGWMQHYLERGTSGAPVWKEKLLSTWPFQEKNRRMVYTAGGVAALLLVCVCVAGISQGGSSGSGSSYVYEGSPTQSDSCAAGNPRTYCGDVSIDKGKCEALGCCWSPAKDANKNVPSCFHPNAAQSMGQYKVTSVRATELGHELSLELRQSAMPSLGPDVPKLTALIEAYSQARLHIKITPASPKQPPRWEVPAGLLPRPVRPSSAPTDPLFNVTFAGVGEDFWVEVRRVSDASGGSALPVFSAKGWGLVFKEQYMQLTTSLDPDSALFGIGESTMSTGLILPRNGKIMTMWNQDTGAFNYDVNLYGSHPFYLEHRQLGKGGGGSEPRTGSHGVYLHNSNGMDIELWKNHLTYRVLGGVFDFAIFMGPEPESVIQQYHRLIGIPALPPRWALGYHQCRWGYHDIGELLDVVTRYQQAGLPLDVIWSDIDYMLDYRVFTFDPVTYPPDRMRKFVEWLHGQGLHWVPIQDPAVQHNTDWEVWNDGVKRGVYVRDAGGQEPYIGQVWAGPSAWPDFFNNETHAYWYENIQRFREAVPADGLWLDMNEASNFCNGACRFPSKTTLWWRRIIYSQTHCILDCDEPQSSIDSPPYAINIGGWRGPLAYKTIPASGKHSNGWLQYDTHNLYALSEAKSTFQTLAAQTQTRPFILTRASFPGTGRYAAHWTGDNSATWDQLRSSIPGILNSNMWGMPLVGADICGFAGNTNDKLCARWLEAGAFYPFSRNHAEKGSIRQEAYQWPLTRLAAGSAYRLRYRLLPTLYTAFHSVSESGGTVARPLFFEWPGDKDAMIASDTQWMLGSGLLIAPVLWEDRMDGRNVYFPEGTWYRLSEGSTEQQTGPRHIEISAQVGQPSVWGRGGYVLPMTATDAPTTEKAFAAPLRLLVLLPPNACKKGHTASPHTNSSSTPSDTTASANGSVYLDNGLSLPENTFLGVNALVASFAAGCGEGGGISRAWLTITADPPSLNATAARGAAGAWSPADVLIGDVYVRGMPRPKGHGGGGREGPHGGRHGDSDDVGGGGGEDKGTSVGMKAVWKLHEARPLQGAGEALSAEQCNPGDIQVTYAFEKLKLRASRPVPLLCIQRIEWEMPTIWLIGGG